MEVFRLIVLLLLCLHISSVITSAFVIPFQHPIVAASTGKQQYTLLMAGFGSKTSSTSKGKKKKATTNKLKPKKQWDRFMSEDLSSSDAIRVGVRVIDGSTWYEVGEIKTKDNQHTDAGIIKHRTLISDHARRMFPAEMAKVGANNIEYGYVTTTDGDGDDEWTIANKIDVMPTDIDKLIGFRGYPDLTGFYSSSGKAATGDTSQDGYSKMKNKGITGITAYEVHD